MLTDKRMFSKFIQFSRVSIGGLFVAVAAALFFGSCVDAHVLLPHDPIFGISTRYLFWITSGLCLAMALVSLSGESDFKRSLLTVWMVTTLVVYRFGYIWLGSHGLEGYLGSISDAFGVSTATAEMAADAALAYLVLGSYFVLIGLWLQTKRTGSRNYLKMPCPQCGGKIEFPASGLGQTISCPHCREAVILRKPEETLKIQCFFCQGHIEFPAHALSQKMQCPHCKRDITLKMPDSARAPAAAD